MNNIQQKHIIVVLGMHRSGTSVIARSLEVLGVDLGERLMPSAPGNNEKGFWEDLDVNALNIDLLRALGHDWHTLPPVLPDELATPAVGEFKLRAVEILRNKLSTANYFGLKDPRIPRLLPFWQEVFAHLQVRVSYVIACRNPISVARSLARRDGFDLEKGYYLWLEHMLQSLAQTANQPRIVVDYDCLMEDPTGQLRRIAQNLGLTFDPESPQFAEYQTQFLEDSLRHNRYRMEDLHLDKSIPPIVIELYKILVELATDAVQFEHREVVSLLERVNGQFHENYPALRYMQACHEQAAALAQQVADRDGRLAQLQVAVEAQQQTLAERDGQLNGLTQAVAERDARLAELDKVVTELEDGIAAVLRAMANSEEEVHHLARILHGVEDEQGPYAGLVQVLIERNHQIAGLRESVRERDERAAALAQRVAERDERLAALSQAMAERDDQIAGLTSMIAERDAQIMQIRFSRSWKVTSPLRAVGHACRAALKLPQRARRAEVLLRPHIYKTLREPRWGLRMGTRAMAILRTSGWQGLRQVLADKEQQMLQCPCDYQEWIRQFDSLTAEDRANIRHRIQRFSNKPLISVVMPVFNPPPKFLDEAIQSVRRQVYPYWELCIADDASTNGAVHKVLERHRKQDKRIKVIYRDENGHISRASNSALEIAEGDFVALLDHDDAIPEHALFWVADAINTNPNAGVIYSDEDKIDKFDRRYAPYFKCEFNYELLLAQNVINHLGVYRTSLLHEVGGFRTGFEGSQDYDLVLRVIERLEPHQVVHVPRVLYHWRAITGSTALAAGEKNYAAEAGRRAVQEHLERTGRADEVVPAPEAPMFNRVIFARPSPPPFVSIIIPTRDRADLLGMCVDSVLQRTTYQNYEILIIDNGSREAETFKLFERLPKEKVRILRNDAPFNFSTLNNYGARLAHGELVCLMNNDIEILTPDWLEEMASFAVKPDIGCVGARLLYPDGRLQHGGVILGVGGVAGHSHKYLPSGADGYFCRAKLHQSLSAVTAACLLVRRSIFEEVGGLDESLAVAFNDIDFCLRVRDEGYRNVWTPYAEMTHHESASRGFEDNPEKQARFAGEVQFMQQRWGDELMHDPAYSPNLTLCSEDFAIAWPPRVSGILARTTERQ